MKIKIDSFLKAEDLNGATSKAPVEGKIVDVRLVPADELGFKSEEDRYELKVELNGQTHEWLANKTSLRVFEKAFGDDSDNWLDKTIKLYSVEQNVSGKIKDVIYATA